MHYAASKSGRGDRTECLNRRAAFGGALHRYILIASPSLRRTVAQLQEQDSLHK